MNVYTVQDAIISNPEYICVILEKLGHDSIRDRGKYYQCSNLDGDNPTAISILKSTLQYSNYTRGKNGNIITLVQDELGVSFKDAITRIGRWIGIKDEDPIHIVKPFGGFYSGIMKSDGTDEQYSLKVYAESELPPIGLSAKFLKDGVSLDVQKKFGIRFDHDNNAILIPIRDVDGNLVGCKARNNDPHCDFGSRFWAYLPYPKTSIIYGQDINYRSIVSKRIVVITESEKAVQQLATMNCNIGVAIGGHSISQSQAKLIKSLMADKIIVAFDEGISREEIEFESRKLLVSNSVMNNNVSYIYDRDNDVLKVGSKDSPSDNGIDAFNALIKYHTWRVN